MGKEPDVAGRRRRFHLPSPLPGINLGYSMRSVSGHSAMTAAWAPTAFAGALESVPVCSFTPPDSSGRRAAIALYGMTT